MLGPVAERSLALIVHYDAARVELECNDTPRLTPIPSPWA